MQRRAVDTSPRGSLARYSVYLTLLVQTYKNCGEILAGNGTPLNRLLADLLPDTLRAVTCFTSTEVQILTPEGLPGVLVWVIPPFSLGIVLVMTMLLLA